MTCNSKRCADTSTSARLDWRAWSAPPGRPSSINGKRGNARRRPCSGNASPRSSRQRPARDNRTRGSQAQRAALTGAANNAVVYQWEARDNKTTFRRLRSRATPAAARAFRRSYYGRTVRPADRRAPLTWSTVPVDYDRRILELNNDVADLDDLIEPLVTDLGARLIERPCIGIETAGPLNCGPFAPSTRRTAADGSRRWSRGGTAARSRRRPGTAGARPA